MESANSKQCAADPCLFIQSESVALAVIALATETHFTAVKWMFYYLKGNISLGLMYTLYKKSSDNSMSA